MVFLSKIGEKGRINNTKYTKSFNNSNLVDFMYASQS